MKAQATTESEFPTTLQEAMKYFANEDRAFEYMKSVRWPSGVVTCYHCGSAKNSFLTTRKIWKCKDCKKQFSIRLGTIFNDSPIKFDKWICATWLIANAKNGISSYELGRALGVCQKTGWFMLSRIRLALQNGSIMKMGGNGSHVEVDETFIGGKARNMHADVRREKVKKGGAEHMTPVQGVLERGTRDECSKVRLKVLKGRGMLELQGNVREYVLKGSKVFTDEHNGYASLKREFTHEVVNHAIQYVRGHVHVNGLENFWSLLKRAIRGTYVSVEPFHLFRYLDEQAFRFNERKNEDGDKGRFLAAMAGMIGKRLTWVELTGKTQAESLPA